MSSKEISNYRQEALQSFKKNKLFLQEIQSLEKSEIDTFFSNLTEEQVNCLLFIVYFIHLKEIPIFRSAFQNINSKDLKIISSFTENKHFSYYLEEFEEGRKIILDCKYAFPFLVKPILQRKDN